MSNSITPPPTSDWNANNLARVTAAALDQPGVLDAAAVVRYRARTIPTEPQRRAVPRPSVDAVRPRPDDHSDGRALVRTKPLAQVYGGQLESTDGAPGTLIDAIQQAAMSPRRAGTIHLTEDSGPKYQSYAELLTDAGSLLRGLQSTTIEPGDSVVLQFDDNQNFVTALWACVLGGYVPTPAGTAPRYDQDNAVTRRLHNAWKLLDSPLILTDRSMVDEVSKLRKLWDTNDISILPIEELDTGREPYRLHSPDPQDTVIQLLTSGSTGVPKCVRHSHQSILARTWATAATNEFSSQDVSLNWMPLDHVGGIVMYSLRDVVLGCNHINATTSMFLNDPLRWLDWIERFQVTNTWAPNFAFALVNDRAAEIARRSWDLSCLLNCCNAGEAVVSQTAHRFLQLLQPHGLRHDVMRPCWGMSETCSGVTYSRLSGSDATVGVVTIDQASLNTDLVFVERAAPGDLTVTEVGRPIASVGLRIVDKDGRVLPEERVGLLQVQGDTMMQGYYNNPDAHEKSYTADGWFNTGDLAFIRDGKLAITGREGDVIVINGANYLSHDIESVVSNVAGVEPTFVAACAEPDAGTGTDRLIVFYVATVPQLAPEDEIARNIRSELSREVGVQPGMIVAVAREDFPKTPSGKVQRRELLDRVRSGTLSAQSTVSLHQDCEGTAAEATWCFSPSWSMISSTEFTASKPRTGPWLCFLDAGELKAMEDALRLELDVPLITVAPGPRFARLAPNRFVVDPSSQLDYVRVLEAVDLEYGRPAVVVHGWCARTWGTPATSAALGDDLCLSAQSLRLLLRVLSGRHDDGCRLLVVTTNAVWTAPGDGLDYSKATLPGLVQTAVSEHTVAFLRMLDLGDIAPDAWARTIRDEASSLYDEPLVAIRSGARLVPRLLRATNADMPKALSALKPRACYLLTGGLGGIGFELAQYLLAVYQARLLIVGRTPVSGAEDSEKAQRLSQLSELGDVRYEVADVAHHAALKDIVESAEATWGSQLDCILHLAAESPDLRWQDIEQHSLVRESARAFEEMYRAKVYGTWALEMLMRDRIGTHLVLFSSVNGYFGGAGFAAYSSANSFLDGFADYWSKQCGRRVHCLAWSMWDDIGISKSTQPAMIAAANHRGFQRISSDEGLNLFISAMIRTEHRLLLGLDSDNDEILKVLERDSLESTELIVSYVSDDASAALANSIRTAVAELLHGTDPIVRVVRLDAIPRRLSGAPDSSAVMLAIRAASDGEHHKPEGARELALARVWRDVLDVSKIGRNDSFFDLGGDSIKAFRLLNRSNAVSNVKLSIHDLYEYHTIALMAARIEEAEGENASRAGRSL
jgi:acyl-CoA synthetase (AMP-forming)/AMP-acid ligase II/NAD(P)-dependent dehydrogenase (short-subunit alcohol dehydrogenase family)